MVGQLESKIYQGTLVYFADKLANINSVKTTQNFQLYLENIGHPRRILIPPDNFYEKTSPDIGRALRHQVNLISDYLELNDGLVDEMIPASLGLKKAIEYLSMPSSNDDVAHLLTTPDLLPTLLRTDGLIVPERYKPNDKNFTPFSEAQLKFIQKQELDGGGNFMPVAVFGALIGLANLKEPLTVYYSRTPSNLAPTITIYEYKNIFRKMRTRNHFVVFPPDKDPEVFDVSAYSRRVLKRKT